MTCKCSLVIEGVSTGYSAYVPELPTILVTGRSAEELTTRAAEAIRLYWESVRTDYCLDYQDLSDKSTYRSLMFFIRAHGRVEGYQCLNSNILIQFCCGS
jgi:hypothetical protein